MIRKPGLDLLVRLSREFAAAGRPRPWRFLSLSWQDVVVRDEDLRAALGDRYDGLAYHPDSRAIVRWHKCERLTTRIPDWHHLLGLLGFAPTSADLGVFRGCEAHIDLNQTLPRRWAATRWDVVLDNVSHHCFDVAQALRNVARLVARDGYALHVVPLVMVNHGFYSISPTLFHDFYAQGGIFECVAHEWYDVDPYAGGETTAPVDCARRMKDVSTNSMQLALFRRAGVGVPGVPVQAKFVKHPNSLVRKGEER